MSGSSVGGVFGFPVIDGSSKIKLKFTELNHSAITGSKSQGYKEEVYVEYNPDKNIFGDFFGNGHTYNNLVRAANLLYPVKDVEATTYEQKEGVGYFDFYRSFLGYLNDTYKTYKSSTPDQFLEFFNNMKEYFKHSDHNLLPHEQPLGAVVSYNQEINSFKIRLTIKGQFKVDLGESGIGSLFKSDLEYNADFDVHNIPFDDNFDTNYLKQQNRILFFLARVLRHVQFIYASELAENESASLQFEDCVIEHTHYDGRKDHRKIGSFSDLENAVIDLHEIVHSNCVPKRIRLTDSRAAVKQNNTLTQPLLGAPQEALTFSKGSRYVAPEEQRDPPMQQKNNVVCAALRNCWDC